jgi:hypothetical protein
LTEKKVSVMTLWRRRQTAEWHEAYRLSQREQWAKNRDRYTATKRRRWSSRPVLERRADWIVTSFGVSRSEAIELASRQAGKCDVCGAGPGRRGLHVDHDHDSGVIRGVICVRCNVTLGHAGDSPERLEALAEYLRRHGKARVAA